MDDRITLEQSAMMMRGLDALLTYMEEGIDEEKFESFAEIYDTVYVAREQLRLYNVESAREHLERAFSV